MSGNAVTVNNVTSDRSVSVSFSLNPVTILASAGSGGSINPNGSISIPFGGDQNFTITPNSGYHISNVLVDGNSQGAISSYEFVAVSTDRTISASFAPNITYYTVTAITGLGGTLLPSSRSVESGGTTTFTATPNTGYYTSGCTGGTLSGNTVTVSNVTSDRSVVVNFTILRYTLSGYVRDQNNVGISGVTITLPDNDGPTTTSTDGSGYYSIEVPYGWVGHLTASKVGYEPTPKL